MKLKKILKHLDFIMDVALYGSNPLKKKEVLLFEGDKWDIPNKFLKWRLDSDENGEAISYFIDKEKKIEQFVIYIKPPKGEEDIWEMIE